MFQSIDFRKGIRYGLVETVDFHKGIHYFMLKILILLKAGHSYFFFQNIRSRDRASPESENRAWFPEARFIIKVLIKRGFFFMYKGTPLRPGSGY